MRYAAFGAVFFAAGVASMALAANYCAPVSAFFSVWSNRELVAEGYVLASLFAPDKKSGEVVLLDTAGTVVHTWRTSSEALVAYLQPNGNLYVALLDPDNDTSIYPGGGTTGIIQELDWDSNVVWEYRDPAMTHDFEIMADGGVAYLRWHKESAQFAQKVKGGSSKFLRDATVWGTEIVSVDHAKKTTWRWLPEEHLDISSYTLNALTPRNDWSHGNSIRYTKQNPITGSPAYLVSMRNINTIFVIDAADGSIVWQSPKDLFTHQHDATFTDAGNILLFDNGMYREGPSQPYSPLLLASRAVEIDPRTNEIVWEYTAGKNTLENGFLYSSIMSGAERLPNGNTLITSTMENMILEVTPAKEIAWKYVNTFPREDGALRAVFKARKYSGEDTEWGNSVQTSRSACSLFR